MCVFIVRASFLERGPKKVVNHRRDIAGDLGAFRTQHAVVKEAGRIIVRFGVLFKGFRTARTRFGARGSDIDRKDVAWEERKGGGADRHPSDQWICSYLRALARGNEPLLRAAPILGVRMLTAPASLLVKQLLFFLAQLLIGQGRVLPAKGLDAFIATTHAIRLLQNHGCAFVRHAAPRRIPRHVFKIDTVVRKGR